jgi:hypothetical protein
MKTETVTRYETNLDDLSFGYWYKEGSMDDGDFIDLEDPSEEDIRKAASYLKCSTELIDSLVMFAEDVKEHIKIDMIDIWQRLDKLEEMVKRLC